MRRFLAISSVMCLLGGAQPAAGAPLTLTITFTLTNTGGAMHPASTAPW